jgi:preprotein translocase subunit SecG
VLIIAAIVTIFSKADDRLRVFELFGVIFLIFLIIALIVMVTLTRSLGGGLLATFYVNNAGIGYESGHLAKKLKRGTFILSLMSGSISAAGTTLIALSQEENFIPWQDVYSVKIYPSQQVVYVKSKEHDHQITLYCSLENFNKVTKLIAKKVKMPLIR